MVEVEQLNGKIAELRLDDNRMNHTGKLSWMCQVLVVNAVVF